MTASRFDQLFEQSNEQLFWGLITRIEGEDWTRDRIPSLEPAHAVLVRVAFFSGIFGNGGLQYWFECDSPHYHLATAEALRTIGLPEAADALADAYRLFRTPKEYEDFGRRMQCLQERKAEFEVCEGKLWYDYQRIEWEAGRFASRNRQAFEGLRHRLPYDSSSRDHGDVHE